MGKLGLINLGEFEDLFIKENWVPFHDLSLLKCIWTAKKTLINQSTRSTSLGMKMLNFTLVYLHVST